MIILALNCGSSSVKYQLYSWEERRVITKGMIERIGQEYPDHKTALEQIIDKLTTGSSAVLKSLSEISAVGHRVVHGGEKFKSSVLIDAEVLEAIKSVKDLAPLHNPPNIAGIEAAQQVMPNISHIAVFDTAFHQTMPEHSYLYAVPYEWYGMYGVRRYGFHGTSHHYVSKKAAEILNKDYKKLKIISCHLGNGSSIAAVMNGKSIDTSMGFTPLEGIVMGTRSGDIDPAIIPFLMKKEKLSVKEIDDMLNKKSGLFGISGISPDVRVLWSSEKKGNKKAGLALDILGYRIAKYIGAYIAAMNGVDAIVFTAGIGENAFYIRERVLKHFEYLGLKINKTRNKNNETIISADNSKIKAMVIPTNEELQIARETFELVK